jgi:threonine aldolase
MKPIDLRSDTVTRPTDRMRRAMAEAEVGDDVFGERRSHVVRYELSAMSVLSGVMPRMVDAPDGHLRPEQVREAVAPRAYYKSDVSLVVLENTHNLAGGTVLGLAGTQEVIGAAREAGFRLHVDGARIWNAAVALGVEASALVAGADTVMTCLSKGLGCPVGSLVASSSERIEKARRVRKLLGGGMRQAGVLAAAGLVALDDGIPRLAEDHAHARRLGEALARGRGIRVTPPQTNIVVATIEGRPAPEVAAALAAEGVLTIAMDGRTLRLVTHRDVSEQDCNRAAEVIRTAVG